MKDEASSILTSKQLNIAEEDDWTPPPAVVAAASSKKQKASSRKNRVNLRKKWYMTD